jgi:drug/metabolite transporter superfamily protein YnfA
MKHQTPLKIALTLVGLLFVAGVFPLVQFLRAEPVISMMMSLYVTLGIFLLFAVRNPSGHRSLIAFTAGSSLAHAVVMGYQALRGMVGREELAGVAVLIVIGIVLIAFAPPKQELEREPAVT